MKRFGLSRSERLGALALALALAAGGGLAHSDPIDAVPSGTRLGKDNWEIAKGHLPDEILEFYKRGEYSNPIVRKPGNAWLLDPNSRGYWKNKYDWKGNALANWSISAMPLTKAPTRDGSDFWLHTGGGGSAAFAVNYKQDRATVSGMPVEQTEYYVEIPDEIYEVDRVNRMGK